MIKKEEIRKQLKVKLFVSVIFLAIIIGFYAVNHLDKANISGNVIIAPEIGDPCNESGTTYDGSFMKIISPLNNSYNGKNNFNFTVSTDYYGSDIVTTCEGSEPQNCTLELIAVLISDEGKEIYPISFGLPKTNEGNKTYSSTAFQSSNNYTNGNYTMLTKIKYSCVVANFERDERRIQVDTDEPTISEIYPTNSLQINISSNATITLSPRIIATDTLGIKNKTIFDGTNTISLLDNPSYSKTLSPGVYSWNFTAIDLAGNAKTVTSQFRIFSSTTNETQPFNTTNTTQQNLSNTTLFFDSKTTPDNQLTNISSIHITLNANSNESQTNITLKIFDETGKVIYQNSTTEKTIEITYPFISDGTYYYNATFISGNSITNTATRKIIIDTEPPTITINSPTKKQTSFTNSVLIEFSAEDTNDVIKKWINDGTKKIDYTSKLNKTLSEGNYTWTLYAQDKAGNIAQETIRFSIVTEKKTNTIQRLAILIIIVAVILLVILIIFYFLKNKSNPTSSTSDQSPPSNPSQSFNRPVPPINPQVQRPMLRLANPAMFKNNQFQR